MGLVLNKLIGSLTLPELLVQLEISASGLIGAPRIHFGGPVESGRGFVLHSADYTEKDSLTVGDNLALTATLDTATKGQKDERIYLRADKAVSYGDLMEVMNLLRNAGYLKIALVGLDGRT